ncbi:hypothetical protein SLS64_005365 [Diaporthe eres]|uniref:Uncharacterized protein n=1 Tax=Diaporthe eres TaxID=83184 RepID=A0ABR1PBB7_DIAER
MHRVLMVFCAVFNQPLLSTDAEAHLREILITSYDKFIYAIGDGVKYSSNRRVELNVAPVTGSKGGRYKLMRNAALRGSPPASQWYLSSNSVPDALR